MPCIKYRDSELLTSRNITPICPQPSKTITKRIKTKWENQSPVPFPMAIVVTLPFHSASRKQQQKTLINPAEPSSKKTARQNQVNKIMSNISPPSPPQTRLWSIFEKMGQMITSFSTSAISPKAGTRKSNSAEGNAQKQAMSTKARDSELQQSENRKKWAFEMWKANERNDRHSRDGGRM